VLFLIYLLTSKTETELVMKKTLFTGALVVALSSPGAALASGIIAGATEFTQIANNLELILTYVESAQQTVTQINQYETMLTNLMRLTPSELLGQASRQLWQDQGMMDTFGNLRKIIVDGQSIAYTMSNIESQFKRMHPGYGKFGDATDFFRAYQMWSDNTLSQVRNSVAMVTAHSENFASEEGMVQELMTASNSAHGQLQAVQAGNQIGVAMVGQMQKLRQLQMAQMQAQNAYIAKQQSAEDVKMESIKRLFNGLSTERIIK
jgi:P-type conjugative transfer protein TrbJ